jgi:hypothetical protein
MLAVKLAGLGLGGTSGRLTSVVAAVMVSACAISGSQASSPSSSPSLPTGFVRSADPQFGIELALAPGWRQSARDPERSISYAGPLGLTMLIHFERAASDRLDITTSNVLTELTDWQGLDGASESPSKLAGRPAKRFQGQFEVAGQLETLEAYVAWKALGPGWSP